MDRRRGRAEHPPEIKPVDVDGVRTVAIITVLWALAFVVLAFFRSELDDAGRGWWMWASLAGVGLGLLGLEYCRKRRDAIARAELDAEADEGFDDAGDWADGELAALAADDDAESGFDQPTQTYAPQHRTPPATPLPFDAPAPPSVPPAASHPAASPPAGQHTGEQARRYAPGGRPPPGHVTGDFPAVTGDFPQVTGDLPPVKDDYRPARDDVGPPSGSLPAAPPRPTPTPQHPGPTPPPGPPPAPPPAPEPAYPDQPYADTAAPAGYSPEPDRSRRHPRDEELARRYRDEQARAAAAGYEPPSYPEFLQDEAARSDQAAGAGEALRWDEPNRPAEPAPPPPPPRRTPGFESEFFTDEPATDTNRGADFLLDDDDEPGGEYRGRRARRD